MSEEKVRRDVVGQKLQIGDKVVAICSEKHRTLVLGEILYFTPKNARIKRWNKNIKEFEKSWGGNDLTLLRDYNELVKVKSFNMKKYETLKAIEEL